MPAVLSTDAVRARLSGLLPEVRDRYAVRSLSIFGSYARGEQTEASDLDVLVEFDEVPGMITFVGLARLIEDRTGLAVDLATRPMLGPEIGPGIEADLTAV